MLHKIRQGRDGTPIKPRTYQYTEHSAVIVPPGGGSSSSSSSSSSGGLSSEFTATVYPIAKVLEYRDEDGTGEIETNYSYQWHPGTLEMHHEQSVGADILIARNETYFDDRGQIYHTRRYGIDPTSGDVGNHLSSYTWFDAAGNTIKQQAPGQRSFTKTAYDSLGHAVKQYVGYDLSESPCVDIGGGSSSSGSSTSCVAYVTATNVTGDAIFEQTETDYDDAGNAIDATGTDEQTTTYEIRGQVERATSYDNAAVGRRTEVVLSGLHRHDSGRLLARIRRDCGCVGRRD